MVAAKKVAEAPIKADPTPAPAEVRQCTDPESPNFGCVAVKSPTPYGEWLVANPGTVNIRAAGGHWEDDDTNVAEWNVLSAK
jgi:hypothetical protein